MKKTAKFLAVLLAILMMASTFTAFAQTDVSGEKYNYHSDLKFASYGGAKVNEGVSVFEFKLPKYTGSIEGDVYAAFSLLQNCGGVDYVLDLISVEAATGNIVIGSEGKYYNLCTSTGEAMTLQDTPVAIAVVYDDTNGTARYFVNGSLGYVQIGDEIISTAGLKVYDTEFYSREFVQTTSFRLFKNGGAGETIDVSAYEFNSYNVNKGDTARIIGFQENGLTDQIRVIAGIDTLYYNKIGFEIEPFIGGVSKGVSDISENVVFSSISANDKTVTAESVGHRYLAAAEITSLPRPILDNSYLSVRAYTEIDGVRYYDEAINIVVDTDSNNNLQYFFDKDGFIYTNTFDGIDAIPSEWSFFSSDTTASAGVVDGKLQLSETTHSSGAFLYLNQYVGMNTLVQADVTITYKKADNAYLGMLFGYQNAGNFDYMWIRYNGEGGIEEKRSYGSGIEFPNSGITKSKTGFSFELNKTYTLTLICQGEKASFFIDGMLISEGELEGSVRNSLGKIGFIAKGMTYTIDDVIVRTTDDIVNSDVLYSTDFSDDAIASDWTDVAVKNMTSVKDGVLIHKNTSATWATSLLNKELGTGDYIVQADVKVLSYLDTNCGFGLTFRFGNENQFLATAIRMKGDGWAEAETAPYNVSGHEKGITVSGFSVSGDDLFKKSTDEESYVYTITAVCKGREFYYYINGKLVGTASLDKPSPALGDEFLTGKVGIYSKGMTLEVDNFIVRKLDNTYDDFAVYKENFDSYAALPDGWKTTSPGTEASVSVTPEGKLNIIEPKGSWFITYLDKDLALTNYEFSAKITVNEYEKGNAARYFGLVFNYKDVNNFAKASFRINGEGSMGLMRLNGAAVDDSTAFNLVEDIGITPAIGKTYTLKVKVVNDLATFYVDDKELGTYNLSGRLAAGKIGFIASGVSISVDNVVVTEATTATATTVKYYDMMASTGKELAAGIGWASTHASTYTFSDNKLNVSGVPQNVYVYNYYDVKDADGNYLGYNKETGTNDYIVEAKITLNSVVSGWDPYIGFALRYSNTSKHIELGVKNGNGRWYIDWNGPGGSINADADTTNFKYAGELSVGKAYNFKAICLGNSLTFFIDGVQLGQVTIPDALATGTFGFLTRNDNYSVDSIKVTSAVDTSVVLYESDFATKAIDKNKFEADWVVASTSTASPTSTCIIPGNEGLTFNISENAYLQAYLQKNIGYNEATKTNDYTVEAKFTVTDWVDGGSNVGIYLRQDTGTTSADGDFVYAAIRADGSGWIQGMNSSSKNLNSKGTGTKLVKDQTYILRATSIGNNFSFAIGIMSNNKFVPSLSLSVTNDPSNDGSYDYATGGVGFAVKGISGLLESFVVTDLVYGEPVYDYYDNELSSNGLAKNWGSTKSSYFSMTEDGKLKFTGDHGYGLQRHWLPENIGYNEKTGTNDYVIEAKVNIVGIVNNQVDTYMGILFRQNNTSSSTDYVYAGVRYSEPSGKVGWVELNNSYTVSHAFRLTEIKVSNNDTNTSTTTNFAFKDGNTYTLKLICKGYDIKFYVDDVLVSSGTIPANYQAQCSTGYPGLVTRGLSFILEDFTVTPIVEDEEAEAAVLYENYFNNDVTLPTEWHDEIGARRNGVIANLSIGTSAKNNSNGSLIVDARGSVHNVIALDKTVEGGFIYELDLTMLRQDNIKDVSYKMGPVFGLQDDSVSVGVDSRVGAIGNTSSQKTDVEAWLLKNANSYYPGVDSSWHNFGSFSFVNATGTTYRYKVVAADGYASIYVDGKLMLTCAIDDPFLEGRFGIMLRNAAVSIDNVKIQKYLKKYEIPADIDAEPSVVLRVATFNIGDFSTASGTADIGISKGNGTDVTKQEYIDALNSVSADIWGLQEDSQYFNGNTKESANDAIYSKVLPYHDGNFTGGYNSKAFLSGYELYDVKAINYSKAYDAEVYPNGTTDYGHPWFLTGKVMVNDVEVTLVTLHFDWQCKIRRAQQIADILEHVKGLDYVIVLGDVNPDDKVNGESLGDYVNDRDNQYFIDQGYTVANGGEFGLFYTTMTKGAPRNTNNPCDNIYTSSKITMLNAEPVYMSWMNDHAIVIADIEIK